MRSTRSRASRTTPASRVTCRARACSRRCSSSLKAPWPACRRRAGASTRTRIFQIDTTNILFICGGAFAGLEKVIENRTEASGIGFGAAVKSKKQRSLSDVFQEIEPEDLIKFGLIPELVGRMPVVTALAELHEDALVQILTEPKNALVKQYSKLLAMEGAELEIRP